MEKRGGEWMKWNGFLTMKHKNQLVYVCMRCIKRHCSLLDYYIVLVVSMKQCMQSYRAKPWQEGPLPKVD